MKGAGRLAVQLLAAATLAGGARAADRDWVVGIGGGPLYLSTTDTEFLGPAASAWVATPLQAGFLLGAELGWYQVGEGDGHMFPADNYSYQVDDLQNFVVTAMFRAQFPARSGPSPFVAAGTGVSWSTGGDTHVSGSGYPQGHVFPGPTETVWASSIELGIRVAIPGAWPDPEIAIRKVAWLGDQTRTAVQPRFALVW